MVEIKESKESKTPDVTRLVDESMARLHDMERRLHAVQGHLSGLVNMANALHQAQPGSYGQILGNVLHQSPPAAYGQSPTTFGWSAPDAGPSNPFAFVPGQASPFLAATANLGPGNFSAAPFASPATIAPRTSTPWITPFASATTGLAAPGISARDFEKLPAIARVPEVNFVDAGDRYVIKIELPGVRKDDLDITVSERMITVDAEARQEIGDGTVLVGEVIPAVFRRSISLPTSCNSTKGKANLKDGFLTLEVPKKEPTEGPRRLDVAYG